MTTYESATMTPETDAFAPTAENCADAIQRLDRALEIAFECEERYGELSFEEAVELRDKVHDGRAFFARLYQCEESHDPPTRERLLENARFLSQAAAQAWERLAQADA